jgi:monoamine oxidase
VTVRCDDGARHACDAALLTVPLPLLADITLPAAARAKAAAAADIGYGSVVKILLRFSTRFWPERMSFLFSDAAIPTWWTQYPAPYPLLTGWLAGPRAEKIDLDANALVETALASLAEIFTSSPERLRRDLVAACALDWGTDRFSRGGYSYATPRTRQAQALLKSPDGGAVFFAGEALYAGQDIGTVEAALSSGLDGARAILAGS